ncbi:hypothetical protein [Mycolicibacterium fortuitum]|uniref:hypothetical protein n=1 Tax=Mycolicibacterium fortuitum TaxID=1766 RepID=UPI0013F660CE|nr:hypothetical protein [Mycolicibacterium fortuitum]
MDRNHEEPRYGVERPMGMDAEQRQVLADEGLDPDDPQVAAGIELVRWELSMLFAHDD